MQKNRRIEWSVPTFLQWQGQINLNPSISYIHWFRNQKLQIPVFSHWPWAKLQRQEEDSPPFHDHQLGLYESWLYPSFLKIHLCSLMPFVCILFTEIGSQVHIPHYSLLWNFDNVLKTSFHFIKYSFSWLFFLTIQYSIFFFTGLPWESIYLVCFVPTANY